jgi:hypothetical protein
MHILAVVFSNRGVTYLGIPLLVVHVLLSDHIYLINYNTAVSIHMKIVKGYGYLR